jgi:hypothetical protein
VTFLQTRVPSRNEFEEILRKRQRPGAFVPGRRAFISGSCADPTPAHVEWCRPCQRTQPSPVRELVADPEQLMMRSAPVPLHALWGAFERMS